MTSKKYVWFTRGLTALSLILLGSFIQAGDFIGIVMAVTTTICGAIAIYS